MSAALGSLLLLDEAAAGAAGVCACVDMENRARQSDATGSVTWLLGTKTHSCRSGLGCGRAGAPFSLGLEVDVKDLGKRGRLDRQLLLLRLVGNVDTEGLADALD